MGKLHFGIHSGTLMSGEFGDLIDVDSEDAAKKKADELAEHFSKMGCMIWFAHYRAVPGSKFVRVHPGNNYN